MKGEFVIKPSWCGSSIHPVGQEWVIAEELGNTELTSRLEEPKCYQKVSQGFSCRTMFFTWLG